MNPANIILNPFRDNARIVGYDNAKELLVAKKAVKEAIENARKRV